MKKTQWHPLFARLLGLLLDAYYEIQPEVSVSDLPRQGDLLVVRRRGTAVPPFTGLWRHLTDWNVLAYKGPTDDTEEDDLKLLLHVGSGLTYKLASGGAEKALDAILNRIPAEQLQQMLRRRLEGTGKTEPQG